MTETRDLTNTTEVELSVVVPVYNEQDNIPVFIETLVPILRELVGSYEIIFALDPSTDQSEQVILEHRKIHPEVKLVVFSRRFGQPTATLAGIEFSSGQGVVVMDVDLQDPPVLLNEMVAKWREGYDVVYAQRNHRAGERAIKKFVAWAGYGLIDRFGDVPIPRNTGDFRLLDRKVVAELLKFPESHGFLRGLVALVGFRQIAVTFDRPARHAGRGNYNQFLGSIKIGMNGLIAFSSALLSLSTVLGFLAAGLAFLTALLYVTLKLTGVDFPIGNPTIVIAVLMMGGVNLICLGLMGQYVGRIYDEVKHRPRFIVQRLFGFEDRQPTK